MFLKNNLFSLNFSFFIGKLQVFNSLNFKVNGKFSFHL